MGSGRRLLFRVLLVGVLGSFSVLLAGHATAAGLDVFHADSLAGPMSELKKAFESKFDAVTIRLHSGTSKQLAERILKGEACDVFASSSPTVIDEDLLNKRIAGIDKVAAAWYGVTFARVTGEKDLATNRTIAFLQKAAALEGQPTLAQKVIDNAAVDPAKPNSVPDTVRAVRDGRASAGVVYFSAAVAARNDVDIIRFPASVNLSDEIRNAAAVPGTAKNEKAALDFVKFLLSVEGQNILKDTGQPPVVPAIRKGDIPADVN
jgi:ABC-type molybdate transport system substrate-binding protein